MADSYCQYTYTISAHLYGSSQEVRRDFPYPQCHRQRRPWISQRNPSGRSWCGFPHPVGSAAHGLLVGCIHAENKHVVKVQKSIPGSDSHFSVLFSRKENKVVMLPFNLHQFIAHMHFNLLNLRPYSSHFQAPSDAFRPHRTILIQTNKKPLWLTEVSITAAGKRECRLG